jgi:hypothetical protein
VDELEAFGELEELGELEEVELLREEIELLELPVPPGTVLLDELDEVLGAAALLILPLELDCGLVVVPGDVVDDIDLGGVIPGEPGVVGDVVDGLFDGIVGDVGEVLDG